LCKMSTVTIQARHPLALVFLLHIAIEAPFAVQGAFTPLRLPFLDMTNTTIAIIKLYAVLALGSCIAALLSFPVPDFYPGKRAFAVMLIVYHTVASTILYQTPRFIPISFGTLAEGYKVTPENVWGTAHGIAGLLFVFWWQATVPLTRAAAGRPA